MPLWLCRVIENSIILKSRSSMQAFYQRHLPHGNDPMNTVLQAKDENCVWRSSGRLTISVSHIMPALISALNGRFEKSIKSIIEYGLALTALLRTGAAELLNELCLFFSCSPFLSLPPPPPKPKTKNCLALELRSQSSALLESLLGRRRRTSWSS